ncbi:MAG: hypothetical protein WC654_04660 [Patescibacteria group bacterium]
MNQTVYKRIVISLIVALIATTVVLLTIRLKPFDQTSLIPDVLLDEEVALDLSEEKQIAPFFFSTNTHMEGDWTQAASNLAFFKKQAGYLRTAMDYAQAYDAVLTFESEIPFAEGMLRFDDNVFQEALDRKMGIGSHCDISPKIEFTDEEMTREFQKRKDAVDAVVDPLQNLGCSGGGGPSDWYTGAVGAGFKHLDGLVGYHYLAMSLSERPVGWTNREIIKTYFHYPAPWEEEKRFYPIRVSASSFQEDSTGELVISGGSIGMLTALAEGIGCVTDCALTQGDVDILVEKVRDFAASRDTSRVAKMEVYIPSKTYSDPQIEYFFQELQKLQDEGVMQWASQKTVYEAFVAWEQGT